MTESGTVSASVEGMLSVAMQAAIAAIRQAYAIANAEEVERWGKPLTHGICIDALKIERRTLKALANAGLILITPSASTSVADRRGDYGRRLGGTTRRVVVTLLVKPL